MIENLRVVRFFRNKFVEEMRITAELAEKLWEEGILQKELRKGSPSKNNTWDYWATYIDQLTKKVQKENK